MHPVSRPALRPVSSPVDVAIVGAGAAGIAAARLLGRLGLDVAVLEARERVGGRLVTASFGGHPVDLGAHWLHAGALNPLVRLAGETGERLRRSPGFGRLVIDGRRQPQALTVAHGRAFDRADAAFSRWAREEDDRPISAALPPLGRWRGPIGATMALISGRPLDEVSVKDFPSEEFGDNYFVGGGYGHLVSRLARGLPIALSTPVTRIGWSGSGLVLDGLRGSVNARRVLVTVPTSVLDRIAFAPGLPAETAEAAAAFRPGTYEHVILNWPFEAFRGPDRLVKVVRRGRSVGLMTNMEGAPFHYLELDHATVAATRGPAERARLARALLRDSFGARAIRDLRVLHVTDWLSDPWSRGSWAVIPPGRSSARAALARPVADRIWFAGEATSRALWGTAGGAWEEGERAAREIAASLGR